MADLVFYTNESVSIAVSEGLKRRGVNAISARDAGNLSLSDEDQLAYANKNNLVIVTHDDDFLSIAIELEQTGSPNLLWKFGFQSLKSILEEIQLELWRM